MVWLGLWLGSAWHGSARLGSAWLGLAWFGLARLRSARLGSARLGSARLGLVGRNLVWLGLDRLKGSLPALFTSGTTKAETSTEGCGQQGERCLGCGDNVVTARGAVMCGGMYCNRATWGAEERDVAGQDVARYGKT